MPIQSVILTTLVPQSGGGGGDRGKGEGGLFGVIVVRVWCSSQYFETYPIPILGQNGPIHILDRLKCWHIHLLPFDFLYPFMAGS